MHVTIVQEEERGGARGSAVWEEGGARARGDERDGRGGGRLRALPGVQG